MSRPHGVARTPREFRTSLFARGVTVAAWADEHGFKRHIATDVLRGKVQGLSGEARKCAVAMGLKPDPNQEHTA